VPNTPFELAMVSKPVVSLKKPAVTSFLLAPGQDRVRGHLGAEVRIDRGGGGEVRPVALNSCLPGTGTYSGFSGARRAVSSARRTACSSDLSSNSLIDAVPWRLPKATVTTGAVFVQAGGRDAVARKADIALAAAVDGTLHSSAFENDSTRSQMRFASSWFSCFIVFS
jgi:hypothetical protein